MNREEKITELLKKEKYHFDDLVTIVAMLRSEGGCPWDIEQTHKSIRNDFIEETYEVIEAIDTDDPKLLREELGDVMLQVVFHARISEEDKVFTIDDVANDICAKLIHRHPHVFGNVCAETPEEVLKNWDAIKSEEKSRVTVTDKLKSVPPMLPALMRATKVGKKAKCFDFPTAHDVLDKISEELAEVSEAIEEGSNDHISEEIGDLLLSITSLCRKLGVDAEQALSGATDKFISRFEGVENCVLAQNKTMDDFTVEELDRIWAENKKKSIKFNKFT